MIGSLRGVVVERTTTEVLIEVGGVGYRVQLPPSSLARIPLGGGEQFLHIHHHIREDHQALYGFLTAAERNCFESLISAHGVGPALAMAILSVHRPDQLVQVLADADVSALCLVPGVGKKTAARLLVELRAKLDVDTVLGAVGALDGRPALVAVDGGLGPEPAEPRLAARQVVRQALAELGYQPDEIRRALDGLAPADPAAGATVVRAAAPSGPTATVADPDDESVLLRAALQRLAGVR